jgi:hypothetical protein
MLDTDVQFIRRYTLMDGKVKTQAQVLTLIHSLQKAILERRIRKTSPYAAEIKTMQEQLIKLYEKWVKPPSCAYHPTISSGTSR